MCWYGRMIFLQGTEGLQGSFEKRLEFFNINF